MGFKFHYLCDLLSDLEANKVIKATTASRNSNPDGRVVNRWFAQHGKRIHAADTDRTALLSCMFPEKRTDRVYWLQGTTLVRVIGRCLLLGSSRREELERWRVAGGIDLGKCVEYVMRQAEDNFNKGQEVTIEEIDDALNKVASRCRFSGVRVRRQHAAVDVEETLGPLYRRLSSRDAKWLTRMILKSHHPVVLPVHLTMKRFHFLLPHLLLFQDSFESSLEMLASEPLRRYPPNPDPKLAKDLEIQASQHLVPMIGVKIGRPEYHKARSIKHCCQMIGRRRMSIERKYDGEYCQIQIDLTQRFNPIQIFLKSGKDSTDDRAGIHNVIRDTLKIGKPECKFSRQCILEGELLVWSDKQGKIADFHKLRRFIARSGTLLGIESDSPPQPYEHLMIVFFDILLLDDDVCLRKPHRERRLLLKDVIQTTAGYADIAEQRIVDFSRHDSQSRLQSIFRKGIADRWEGFVLKGCEDPYFSILPGQEHGSAGRWIKLKKDYIPGLGDTMDLALIGARYDSRDAVVLGQAAKISWTHFYIGCLLNKEAVLQHKATPRFQVVDVINRHGMSRNDMLYLNLFGQFSACEMDSSHGFLIEIETARLANMTAVFRTPFVVEMLGSGFEKPSGARHYALRFPRIQKIHSDRSFEDAASYQELQLLAEEARSAPAEDLQEELNWGERLRMANISSRYLIDRSQSPLSTTTSCPSPTPNPAITSSADLSATTDSNHGSSGQSHSCGLVEQDQRTNLQRYPQADHIPIYIDDSTTSASSPERSKLSPKRLASIKNSSTHPRTNKRQEPTGSILLANKVDSVRHCGEIENNVQTNAPSLSTPYQASSTSKRRKLTTASTARVVIGTPESYSEQSISTKSTLMAIPSYIHHYHLISKDLDEQDHLINDIKSNFLPSLDSFLQSLWSTKSGFRVKSASSDTSSVNLALGLMVTNISQGTLGTLLFELSQAISQRLHSKTGDSLNGKIFILDNKFLTLDARSDDARFNLRDTWESIGQQYLYACISWWSPKIPGTTKCETSEIPGTPTEDAEVPRMGARDLLQSKNATKASHISITFESHELGILGDLIC